MAKIFNLQLFAEGAAAGNAGTPAGSTASNPPGNESGGNGVEVSTSGTPSVSKADSSLKEGAGSSDAGNNKLTDEQRQAAYDAFISENKDLHQAHIQNIFNKRFKDDKQKDETIASQNEILGIIGQKYGIKNGDIEALKKAVAEDNSYLEEAAEREGLTVDQYREVSKLRADAERTRKLEEERQAQSYAQQQLNHWFKEAAELKDIYPDFDFRAEAQNPEFISMLKHGIPVRHAYEVIHREEIAEKIRKDAERAVTENIRNRQERPAENGLKGSIGGVIDKNLSKQTKEDRERMVREAMMKR